MDITFKMFIEKEVPENEVIISRTDLSGVITYVNDVFAEISGYSANELIGKPHNILRHPDMPKSIFSDLWKTIKSQQQWEGVVKNRRKDGGYYWVYAVISGVYKDGKLVEYKSIRSPIPKEKRIQMQDVYDNMRLKEGENVRAVSYLDVDTWNKLTEKAKEKNINPEELIKELLK